MPDRPVRVRLAPSPTGEVHIGTVWTAWLNWLFARQSKGTFVLRVEDTDQKRFVAGSIERAYEALNWYGITVDEGPEQGGSFGPYQQSERLEIYQSHAKQLVASGHAYYCFCSPERLDQVRSEQQAKKLPPKYDKHCLQLTSEEVAKRQATGETAVIRLNVPGTGHVTVQDVIRGSVTFGLDQIDDSVLMKSDGFPTYHLANVVDDHLMEISHVIRAEEWLPSLPKHLLLYQAFGWGPPTFAHLPLILGTDRSKLSKRHGATAALSFRDAGYLPEAMRNFLALMGWHPKGESEVLSTEDMIAQFRLEDIHPSGAIFDQTKLDWMNGWYIRHLDDQALWERLQPYLGPSLATEPELARRGLSLIKDRIKTLSESNELLDFLPAAAWDNNVRHLKIDDLVPKKGSGEKTKAAMQILVEYLEHFSQSWEAAPLKERVMVWIQEQGLTNTDVLWPWRKAMTLQQASPDVFDVAAVLGAKETIRRLRHFLV